MDGEDGKGYLDDDDDKEEEHDEQEEIFQSRFGSKARINVQNSPSQNGTTLVSFGTSILTSSFISEGNHC